MRKCKISIEIEKEELVVKSIRELTETYLNRRDYTTNNYLPIILTQGQLEILTGIENHKFNVIKKARQVGATTIINSMISCRLVSNEPWDIVVVGPNSNNKSYLLKEISYFTNILINDLDLELKPIINNFECIKFSNGNTLRVVSNKSYFDKHCITYNDLPETKAWIIFDEFAFAEKQYELYNMVIHRIKKYDEVTIISTQNIKDEFFLSFYLACDKKKNWNRINSTVEKCEYLNSKIDNIKKSFSKIEFAESFDNNFIVPDLNKINAAAFITKINSFLSDGEEFTLNDLFDLINSNIITEIKK